MAAHPEESADPDALTSAGYLPPSQFAVLGGRTVFFVSASNLNPLLQTPGPGVTLWASDGTPQGTELIAGFCTDEIVGCVASPRFLGQIGEAVLFELPKSFIEYTSELWRTDGTREGTFRLPAHLCQEGRPTDATKAIAGGPLFFAASDADAGCGLWQSDGTVAGTVQVSDLGTGADDSIGPYGFAVLGHRVFFSTLAPFHLSGLWVSDGTAGGTSLVQGLPFISRLTTVGNRLFFIAPDQSFAGFSLWTSDGTAAGTRQVRHFAVYEVCDYLTRRQCDVVTSFLQPDGDSVLFVADDGDGPQLWRSDGTPGGTSRLTNLASPASPTMWERGVAVLSGAVLFLVTPADGDRAWLWASNGGPALPLTGCDGGCPGVLFNEIHPVPGGRLVVFAGRNRRFHNTGLWASDGTAAGTRLVRDLCPVRCLSYPSNFFTLGDAVYFTAEDENGPGLWRTDGTSAGTVFLGRGTLPGAPGGVVLGSQVLLGLAAGSHLSELWTTSGSEASTHPVATFDRMVFSSNPSFASLGDRVVFTARSTRDLILWSSDGLHTRPLITASRAVGQSFGDFSPLVTAGGRAFTFNGDAYLDRIYGGHLVVTDGTPQGTRTLADMGDTYVRESHEFGGRLVFEVQSPDGQHPALWSSDGTSLGTRKLLDLPVSGLTNLKPLGGFLYFFDGTSLLRTDGTEAGTTRFGNVWTVGVDPEVAAAGGQVYFTADGVLYHVTGTSSEPSAAFLGREVMGLTELDGRLLFFGRTDGDTPQRGLWSTDGTAAGTVFLGLVSAQPPELRLGVYGLPAWSRSGRRLLVRGWDEDHGFELWSTDGTAAGTIRMDLASGSASSYPDSFTVAAGRVWLTANDPAHGREIWVSDGTPAGTHQADEIAPGMFSALPWGLTPAGDNLYFSAYTPLNGRQPWKLPLASVP
jgi:ELWxxDGT repeat protein